MNLYLVIKTLHIMSSVLMVGTGFGTAFYLYFANRTRCMPAIAAVSRLVVRADLWFTTPAVLFQPLSGLWLAHAAGWPPRYWRYAAWWERLGYPAFASMAVIYFFMVLKPGPWTT